MKTNSLLLILLPVLITLLAYILGHCIYTKLNRIESNQIVIANNIKLKLDVIYTELKEFKELKNESMQ